jgi:transcription initiation factor TFIIIB Brf1 subunit/transcription initiation factor TFIIB
MLVMSEMGIELTSDQIAYLYDLCVQYLETFPRTWYGPLILMTIYIIKSQYHQCVSLTDFLRSSMVRSKEMCNHILQRFAKIGYSVDSYAAVNGSMGQMITGLGLTEDWIGKCDRVYRKVQKHPLTVGKSPRGLVAAILFLMIRRSRLNIRQRKLTQRDLSRVCKVTEVTIRNNAHRFGRIISQVLDQDEKGGR